MWNNDLQGKHSLLVVLKSQKKNGLIFIKIICFTDYNISMESSLAFSTVNGNIIKTFMCVNEILFL
jgi:hypothetical protein